MRTTPRKPPPAASDMCQCKHIKRLVTLLRADNVNLLKRSTYIVDNLVIGVGDVHSCSHTAAHHDTAALHTKTQHNIRSSHRALAHMAVDKAEVDQCAHKCLSWLMTTHGQAMNLTEDYDWFGQRTTLCIMAVKHGCATCLKILAQCEYIDFNSGTTKTAAPIVHFLRAGHVASVKVLLATPTVKLQRYADKTRRCSVLNMLAASARFDCFRLIVEHDKTHNPTSRVLDINEVDQEHNMAPLHLAIGASTDITNYLLAQDEIDINQLDGSGRSPLQIAIHAYERDPRNCLAQLSWFTSLLAQPHIRLQNVLHVLQRSGQNEAMKVLLRHPNVDVNERGGDEMHSALEAVVSNENIALGQVPEKELASHSNRSPQCLVDQATILLTHPDIEVNTDIVRRFVLQVTGEGGNEWVMKLFKLISHHHKFDINFSSAGGTHETALFSAVKSVNTQLVNILLRHPNIDPNVRDGNKSNILRLIVTHPRTENMSILKLFLRHPALDVNVLSPAELNETPDDIAQLVKAHPSYVCDTVIKSVRGATGKRLTIDYRTS